LLTAIGLLLLSREALATAANNARGRHPTGNGEPPDSTNGRTQRAGEESLHMTSTLDFLRERRDRRWTTVPRKVLSFYYTWYGRPENHGRWVHWEDVRPDEHWIGSSTHYPAKGAYDSHDPEIIRYHIGLAREHGVDGFIATWWHQQDFHDRALEKILPIAADMGFDMTVYWETVPGQGRDAVERAVNDLAYILERYADHPAWLRVDGRPVVFVYGRVMGQVDFNDWPEIITRSRERYGKDFLLIADGYQEGYARLFDGVHTYNICGWVQKKTRDELRQLSRKSFGDAVALARRHGKISCITVIPGYDDTKIRTPGIHAERLDGDTYRILWQEAIAANPDWVLVTSWNEWHEGSEIEPSWEDGDEYIRMTAPYAARFRETPPVESAAPAGRPSLAPERAASLRRLYAGTTIGVLPGFSGESVFWLVDAGVAVKELRWEDLLDAGGFNARRFPVIVYAAGEHYAQTVRRPRDVDEALLRYLGEGGLLMALPSLPLPFYYNERGEAVGSAPSLGLPVMGSGGVGGWESPPAGVQLAFHLDSATLPGLPSTAPFPSGGDLRWRPATNTRLAEGDIYLSLARLTDADGRSYGDGIAYVEHRASAPKNAKILYAWMRMADIVNANDLFYALFRLAGERMTRP
jgi:hypothetical protein